MRAASRALLTASRARQAASLALLAASLTLRAAFLALTEDRDPVTVTVTARASDPGAGAAGRCTPALP